MGLLIGQAEDNSVRCKGERFEVLFDEETISKRVRKLGKQISKAFKNRKPILVGVLNGSFMFLGDLMRAIDIECEVDFMKLSSYGAQKVSSGHVKELKAIDADIEDRHVIVVEDIVDSGVSMHYILEHLETLKPASLSVATLLHKPEATRKKVHLDYVGFSIPNLFVIGYGLDYGQLGRNLPAIYIQAEPSDEPSPGKPDSLFT